jgi:hypothetical protein
MSAITKQKAAQAKMIEKLKKSPDKAAYYHNILIHKIPYASRYDDNWFASRQEWTVVGFFESAEPNEILTLPYGNRRWKHHIKVFTISKFFETFNASKDGFFKFGNMPEEETMIYPHIHDNFHCTCTHFISNVYIIWNVHTNKLCRIGSECVFQFGSKEMIHQLEKLKKLSYCSKCRNIFKSSETERLYPGTKIKVKDVTKNRKICYVCAIPNEARDFKRCSKCCNLIPKTRDQCLSGACYYEDLRRSPLILEDDE